VTKTESLATNLLTRNVTVHSLEFSDFPAHRQGNIVYQGDSQTASVANRHLVI